MMAMMAAASSVRTMGFVNCVTSWIHGLLPFGFGSSFAPSFASRLPASSSVRPWAGSVPSRAISASGASVWNGG